MLITIILFTGIVLALVPVFAPRLGMTTGGRALGLTVLFVLPVLCAGLGAQAHIAATKRTEFCTSCHTMDLHGRSLRVDDDTLIAATHFQSGAVPRDEACFACHTTYTMYGDFAAKVRGLRHVYEYYTRKDIDETKIKTYSPYHNRECLHCHEGTRRFERGKKHHAELGRMLKIRNNEVGCVSKGCHEFVHDVSNIKDQALWVPPPNDDEAKPEAAAKPEAEAKPEAKPEAPAAKGETP